MTAILGAIAGVIVSTATGWLVLGALIRGDRVLPAMVVRLVLAIILGAFIHSITYLLWALLLPSQAWAYWIFDLLPLALAAAVWRRVRLPRAIPPAATMPPRRLDPWACAAATAFGLAMLCAAAGAVQQAAALPQGLWDAWGMWNYRARMLYLAPPHVADLYAPPFLHTDYPLMLPLTVARLWRYAGDDPWFVPQAMGTACTLLMAVLMAAGVTRLRGPRVGALAGVLLLGSLPFIRQGASQYADHPLALAVLAAVLAAALWLHEPLPRPRRWLVVIGLLAGAAAWTKNEGVLFAGLLTVALAVVCIVTERKRSLKSGAALLVGLLPAVLLLAVHKLGLASERTDLFQTLDPQLLWARATDPARYGNIFRGTRAALAAVANGWVVVPAAVAAVLTAGRRPRGTAAAVALVVSVLLGQGAAYLLIYLLTSAELNWHLLTSADRLALHIWPMLVLALALGLPRWEAAAPPAQR